MAATPDLKTLTTALDDLERRARLMKQAQGAFISWSDLPTLLLLAATMYVFFIAHDRVSSSTVSLMAAVVIMAGWERRRLGARIDAIVKLLAGTAER
jgi:hypothetical protein